MDQVARADDLERAAIRGEAVCGRGGRDDAEGFVNERVVAFALLSFVIVVVPGPSVLFVIGRALSFGRRVAIATVVGNAAGELLQAAGVTIGLGAILAGSELLFAIVKLAGAAYLAFLGIEAIRSRGLDVPPSGRSPAVVPAGHAPPVVRRAIGQDDLRAARAGFIVGLTNPNTTVFFAAVLPQFVATTGAAVPPAALQMIALGVIFAAIAFMSDSCWVLIAGRARAWFARSPRGLGRIRAASGVVMLGLAARLAAASRTV